MKRYYKGSDIPFRFAIKDKNGKIIPLACFDSLEVVFRTTGEQYTKYYKGGGITENEDGSYRIYANENAFGLLPDGLLKYTVSFTLNGSHQEIKECETDIFIKTPKQFQPKANVQDKSITITENNSTSYVIPDGGYEGLGEVTINVEVPFPLEVKEVSITENESTTTITTGEGYSGMSEVNVNVKVPITIKLANGIKFGNSTITKFPDWFDWSEITEISAMFSQCTNLTVFPELNYSIATTANDTFNGCTLFTGGTFTLPVCTSLDSCFCNCPGITKINIYAPKVTNANYLFKHTADRDINPDITLDTGTEARSISCSCMFQQFKHNITPKVKWAGTIVSRMWQYYGGNIIDLTGFEMPYVTNADSMFYDSQCYTEVKGLADVLGDRVTIASSMFWHSCSLVNGVWFDSSNVTNAIAMYGFCEALVTVPEYDFSNVTYAGSIFSKSAKIENLGGFVGLKCNMDLSPCPLLTVDSLMNVINKAADVTSSPKTLTLGSTNLARLTEEQISVATDKGWTLA